jgi:hypothetical protein
MRCPIANKSSAALHDWTPSIICKARNHSGSSTSIHDHEFIICLQKVAKDAVNTTQLAAYASAVLREGWVRLFGELNWPHQG